MRRVRHAANSLNLPRRKVPLPNMKMAPFALLCFLAAAAIGTAADGPDLKAVQHPMSELHAIAKFSIPGSPDWVAIGDSVWISNNPKNNISRLDPKTNQVGAVITVAKNALLGPRDRFR